MVTHLDATSKRLAPIVLDDAANLETVAHGSVGVVADIHHEPMAARIEAKAFEAPWRGQRTLDLTARDPNAPKFPISAPALDPAGLPVFNATPRNTPRWPSPADGWPGAA